MKMLMNTILSTVVLCTTLLFTNTALAKSEKVEQTFDVSVGGMLVVDSDEGSVSIDTWPQNRVEILVVKTASTSQRLETFELAFLQTGNRINIVGNGDRRSRVRVDFQVKVPENFNIDINTGGGSISVDDITGDIKARTRGGSIKTGNVDGNVDLDTSGGAIRIGNITGKSYINTSGGSITVAQGGSVVDADTSGGSINVGPSEGDVRVKTSGGSITIGKVQGDVRADTSGGSISVKSSAGSTDIDTSGGSLTVLHSGGPVNARTSGGNILIDNAEGAIDAKTSGGKIEAHMVQTDNNVDTRISLRSSGGTLTLYIPKSIKASVNAELEITRNARRDYHIYSDFPLTIKGEGGDDVTAEGDINGGGDTIKLKTTNGDIYIKYLD